MNFSFLDDINQTIKTNFKKIKPFTLIEGMTDDTNDGVEQVNQAGVDTSNKMTNNQGTDNTNDGVEQVNQAGVDTSNKMTNNQGTDNLEENNIPLDTPVYFSEIPDIDINDYESGFNKLVDFKMTTSGVSSGVEWRFINPGDYNRYNEFLEYKNTYISNLKAKNDEIDAIKLEISVHRSERRKKGQSVSNNFINSKNNMIKKLINEKDGEGGLRAQYTEKKREMDKTLNNPNLSRRMPYFELTGENMTVTQITNNGSAVYTTEGQRHYVIRSNKNTKKNGYGLINRNVKDVDGDNEDNEDNEDPDIEYSQILGEIMLKFIKKDYYDKTIALRDAEKYQSLSTSLNNQSNIDLIKEKKSQIDSEEEKYITIMIPFYNTRQSNVNGLEFGKVLTNLETGIRAETSGSTTSPPVNFGNFIQYNMPVYYYNGPIMSQYTKTQLNQEKCVHYVMSSSKIHIVEPDMNLITKVIKSTIPKRSTSSGLFNNLDKLYKIEAGFTKQDLKNKNLNCNQINKKGEVVVERYKQHNKSSKMMSFTEQLSELEKNYYGRIFLGIVFCLIAYTIYFYFITFSFGAADHTSLGKNLSKGSKWFYIPKNQASDAIPKN